MVASLFFRRSLHEDEEIVAIIHKHWLVGFKDLILPLGSFALSWATLYYMPFRWMFFVAVLWSVGSLLWLIRNFLDYYLDVWIITDQGIIDLEWHGWFHRSSSRVLYSDIQGVTYEICGILGSLLHYGRIEVEKVSSGATIELDYVSKPRMVEHLILENMEEYLHTKNLKDARQVREVLANIVAEQFQLEELEGDSEEVEDENDET